jgi:hypothetical protein
MFQSEEGQSDCDVCTKGTYSSNKGSWQCQQCDSGTYVHQQQCKKCPNFGVECVNGLAKAQKGYYIYPDDEAIEKFRNEDNPDYFPEFRAYRCPPNYCEKEKCAEFRRGLLCGECEEGYYPSGSKCYPCQFSENWLLTIPFILNFMLVFFVFMTSRDDGSAYDGITKIFLFFVQTTTLFFTINKLGTDFVVFLAFFTFNSMTYMNFDVDEIGRGMCFQSTALLNLNVGIIQPLVSVFQLLLMMLVHLVQHQLSERRKFPGDRVGFNTGPYRRAFVALFLFVFYSVVTSCVQILACQSIEYKNWDGSISVQDVVVVAAPSVSCLEHPYELLKVVAILVLTILTLLALGSLVRVLLAYKKGYFIKYKDERIAELDATLTQHEYNKEHPDYIEALETKKDMLAFFNNWSGVFRGYDHRHFYWEYVMLARRASVICIVSYLHEAYDRYFGLSLICIGSLVLHVISYPFSEPRQHVVNVHKGSLAFKLLSSANHLETMSLSVLALLVQLMLSEAPDREAIVLTKVTLILITLVVLGATLIYVVLMEKFGYRKCNKYVVKDDDEAEMPVKAVADKDEEPKEFPPDVDGDEPIPQAVDNDEDNDGGEPNDGETRDTDSEDLFATEKPQKQTNDDDTDGDGETGGDTLETNEDGTGDTTNSDVDIALLDTQDTNDKDLDEALAASAAHMATKGSDGELDAALLNKGGDLESALAASAEEAALQAAAEDIDLDQMLRKAQ